MRPFQSERKASMCWYILGAVNGNVSAESLADVNSRHECNMPAGTRHAVKMAVLNEDWSYHITGWMCDCASPVGAHDPDDDLITDLAALLTDISLLNGAKTISLCKVWNTSPCKHERSFRFTEMDLRHFLADFEPSIMYTLDCSS